MISVPTFAAQVVAAKALVRVVLVLKIGAVFVANDHAPLDFTVISTTCVIVAPGNGNLATQLASKITNPATIATATQVATATNIAATISLAFNSRILPVDVRDQYESLNNPTDIMIQSAIQPFTASSGGCGLVLSYLNPPIGAGV